MLLNRVYYLVKPLIPWRLRVALRRARANHRRRAYATTWPINPEAGAPPPNWPGWPNGKQFAVVLTHDVEGQKGLDRIEQLMDVESRLGFRSSFNFVPEGQYRVLRSLREAVDRAGFEVGVHGLHHDGKLFSSKKTFASRATRINSYVREWNASGFRAPLMQHRLGWQHQIAVEYDLSTFDTDPFEPEPTGAGTIFPYWVSGPNETGFVELPYTLVQDFTLFVILQEKSIDIWKEKVKWVAERGGMVLLNTHPDYICFDPDPSRCQPDEFPVKQYQELLSFIRDEYEGRFWHALPRDVSRYYKEAAPPSARNTRKSVCMVSHSYYRSDNRIRRYAESLAKRGDRVDVISLSVGDVPLGVQDINGVQAHLIQKRTYDEQSRWSYMWRLLTFFWKAMIKLRQLHSERGYDLIHVHNIPDFLVFAACFPKWTGTKIVLDIHDIVPELFADKFAPHPGKHWIELLKWMERASARFADHVIISNHLWQQKLTTRSFGPEKCSVFVNNVDPDLFYPRKRTRTDGKFVILFHGTFQKHQGLDIAIEALSHIKNEAPEAELHFYGGGGGAGMTEGLAAYAESLGVKGRVLLHPGVHIDEIPQVIANADLGVVPKRADSFGNEAYSTKIMEFMSQGVPVVVSRTKIDSFYFDEQTVRFFESGDSRAMADAILEVMRRPELRAALSAKGREYAARNGWQSRKRDYLALVDALTTERMEPMVPIVVNEAGTERAAN